MPVPTSSDPQPLSTPGDVPPVAEPTTALAPFQPYLYQPACAFAFLDMLTEDELGDVSADPENVVLARLTLETGDKLTYRWIDADKLFKLNEWTCE